MMTTLHGSPLRSLQLAMDQVYAPLVLQAQLSATLQPPCRVALSHGQ